MQDISDLAMNSSYLCLNGIVASDGAWKIMKGSTLHCIMQEKSQPFRLTLGLVSSLNSALKHWNDFFGKHVKVEVLKSFILVTGYDLNNNFTTHMRICKLEWTKKWKEKVSQVHFECISFIFFKPWVDKISRQQLVDFKSFSSFKKIPLEIIVLYICTKFIYIYIFQQDMNFEKNKCFQW